MRGSSRRSVARNSLQSLVCATLLVCRKYYCSVLDLCLWTLYCLLVLSLLVCGQSWERSMLMSVHSIQSVYFEVSRSSFLWGWFINYGYTPIFVCIAGFIAPTRISSPMDVRSIRFVTTFGPSCLWESVGPCMPPVVGRSIFYLVLQHSDFLVRIHSCHIR